MNSYTTAMRRYLDFSGRSSRSEFWLFVLFTVIIFVVAMILDRFVLGSEGPGLLYFIAAIVHLIPGISVSVRRLHDIDRTGLWVLLFWLAPLLVSLVGIILMGGSVLMMMSGDQTGMAAGFATMGAGFLLIAIVDIIIAIIAIVFYVTAGTPGTNTYGPAPV
jgi:uncharacterized membrane protein YhaH (DUF805 family)